VTILMATWNGARHLRAQLASLLVQTHGDWVLWVGDDGSRDDTRAILARFVQAHPGRLARVVEGSGRGPAANFLHLLCHPDLPAGPVALADQDDVWLKGKLARALRRIGAEDRPTLYAAESVLTDAALRPLSRSRAHAPPSFRNALVQNLFSGHTTVLNAAALDLVRRAGPPPEVRHHDWWLYQLVSGAGGRCLLDPLPVALYRQHTGNAMGAPDGPGAALRRLNAIARADYARWMAGQQDALRRVRPLLTPEAHAMLDQLAAARSVPARLRAFRRLGLHRDTRRGTAALYLAAALGLA
jgi:glycosyltransferase involved in cell wall biosynthesis